MPNSRKTPMGTSIRLSGEFMVIPSASVDAPNLSPRPLPSCRNSPIRILRAALFVRARRRGRSRWVACLPGSN